MQAAAADHETLIIRRPWNDNRRLGHISASEGCGKDVYRSTFLMPLFILHITVCMAAAFLHHDAPYAAAAFLSVQLVITACNCNAFFMDHMQILNDIAVCELVLTADITTGATPTKNAHKKHYSTGKLVGGMKAISLVSVPCL